MNANQQLELGFNAAPGRTWGRRRASRAVRAQWWFDQMRAAVAKAITWPPADPAGAEPIAFTGVSREAKF
jgi:hypothetical protein